jgi:hypothetical protein
MRFRLIATYLGAPYQAALGPDSEDVTLFAACPPPEELGFSSAAGHWRKLVGIDDLDALRQARPKGSYRGASCLVLDDQGERLHIAYLGSEADQARQLGYWEIDREVFEMVVPRGDVGDLTEEQLDIPLTAAAFPPAVTPAPLAAPAPLVTSAPLAAPVMADGAEVAVPHVNGHHPLDRVAAWHGSPEAWPASEPAAHANGNGSRPAASRTAARTGRRDRISIQAVFAELLDLAAIPQAAYAVDEEVPGAMCLVKTDDGFEVFASSDEARHEVRFFEDEEAAYFYLFGVLAAEAVSSGWLSPAHSEHTESLENISEYLRARNLHNSPPGPVRVRNSRRG